VTDFPVIKGDRDPRYRTDGKCAQCEQPYPANGPYTAMDALCILMENGARKQGTTSDLNELTLGLWYVEDFAKLKGRQLPIARRVRGGHATLFFCSIACMRRFLNTTIDRLERGDGAPLGG
jgi:hypothetical protein